MHHLIEIRAPLGIVSGVVVAFIALLVLLISRPHDCLNVDVKIACQSVIRRVIANLPVPHFCIGEARKG